MSPTKTFVDAEAAAKAWAKADTAIKALIGGSSARVFVDGVNNDAAFPQLVVNRAGGAPDSGEAPLDVARISFSCWAARRGAAGQLAYTVMSSAESMAGPTAMGSGAVGLGAVCVLGPLYLTDQADEQAGRRRYVVDIDFVIRAG